MKHSIQDVQKVNQPKIFTSYGAKATEAPTKTRN